MIRRTTWIVLVVFVAVLGAAIYVQRTHEGKLINEPTPTMMPALFNIQESSIKSLQISSSAGESLVMEHSTDGAWTITKPLVEATDTAQAQASISELLGLQSMTVLDPAPPSEATGLATAAYTITVSLMDGKNVVAKVGKVTPTESGYYLQVDGGPVVVANKYSIEKITNMIANPPVLVTPTPEFVVPEITPTEAPSTATPTPAPTATAMDFLPTLVVSPDVNVTTTVTATLQATP